MWKPAERIKHPILPADWPTAEAAGESALFSPCFVGPIQIEERTWVPAMVPWRATEEGFVTPEVLAWYERFAVGRPGAIVIEATGIRDVPSGPLLRIGHDRFLPGLAELARTVRRASGGRTRLFVQLIDFLAIRRRPRPETYFQRYLELEDRHRQAVAGATSDEEVRQALTGMSATEIETVLNERELEALRFGSRERVTDVDLEHIRELPERLPGLFPPPPCALGRRDSTASSSTLRMPIRWRRSSRR